MTNYIDVRADDIEQTTDFSDVRDLHAVWISAKGDALPDLALFSYWLTGAQAERTLLMRVRGNNLVYEHVGNRILAVFGHDPTGMTLEELTNPGAQSFRPVYYQVLQSGQPGLGLHNRVGPGAIGITERLVLPVRDGDDTCLLCYVRPREDATHVLRSVFNVSADAITVLNAVRGKDGAIEDFLVVAANTESARRLNALPERLLGWSIRQIWPFAEAMGLFGRFTRAVNSQIPDVFDASYPQDGKRVDRQLRLAPHGEGLTVTDVDIGPTLAATRAIDQQHKDLIKANEMLEARAVDLMASYESLERTTQDLRDEITRNRALEAELVYLAHHDSLTGLPNRTFFEQRFEEKLKQMKRARRRAALCIIDLDHFKDINDGLGHDAGDMVLREISSRLRTTIRKSDVIGRLGGDEFAVVLTNAQDIEDAATAVRRMMEAVARPFSVKGQDVPISLSAGIAIFPADGRTFGELMADADIAVYRAKRAGRGRTVFFEPSMRDDAERRYGLLKALRLALDARQILPVYQPLIDIRSGRLIGFEALARWLHPERGMLAPAAFSETFDEPDIAQALTRMMIERVLGDLAGWRDQGISVRANMNVTAFDLRNPGFAQDLVVKLHEHGLKSAQLGIEVTETTILSRDAERIAATLHELRRLGFSIALDDFGTGYASLSHLRSLPVNSLKIDRTFISDLEHDPKTTAIVRSIIELAAALDLEIIAEGVETQLQLDAVRALGCPIIQGYLIAQPMVAAGVPDFIAQFVNSVSSRRWRVA
ncbi:putative bifunctional diguanylate cyclase/phosphodiesterase [Kaistia granuli]|uniref:putative bifunctional diguanylate cyclase/phosphodiesterase n=1 Tax=Kaistia granuli TaxID=363259 RepID=UPI000374D1A1|nr:EAL domain-containing protein [Kaistia granuli]